MGQDAFEIVRRVGDRVLAGLDRGDRSAQKFKQLLGVINQTLFTTHKLVIARLTQLEKAQTLEEAKTLLESVRLKELTEAFRVEGLCDLLEGLGVGLYRRGWAAREEGFISEDELTELQRFGQSLYQREGEVALLYSEALSNLLESSTLPGNASLSEIQERAAEVKILLTNHISDFRAKADRFMRLSIPD